MDSPKRDTTPTVETDKKESYQLRRTDDAVDFDKVVKNLVSYLLETKTKKDT